jgi:hypothetical protein
MSTIWKALALGSVAALMIAANASAKAAKATRWTPPPTTTAPVSIFSPLPYSFYSRYGNVILGANVRSSVGGDVECTISWGDGSTTETYADPSPTPGVWTCAINHVYSWWSGWAMITVSATDSAGPVGSASTFVYII